MPPGPDGGLEQRPLDRVPLRVAAAELVHPGADRHQVVEDPLVPAGAEGQQAPADREPYRRRHLPAGGARVALAGDALEGGHDGPGLVKVARADVGHDRVHVVERVEIGRAHV